MGRLSIVVGPAASVQAMNLGDITGLAHRSDQVKVEAKAILSVRPVSRGLQGNRSIDL